MSASLSGNLDVTQSKPNARLRKGDEDELIPPRGQTQRRGVRVHRGVIRSQIRSQEIHRLPEHGGPVDVQSSVGRTVGEVGEEVK
jgi:hypothetical protein